MLGHLALLIGWFINTLSARAESFHASTAAPFITAHHNKDMRTGNKKIYPFTSAYNGWGQRPVQMSGRFSGHWIWDCILHLTWGLSDTWMRASGWPCHNVERCISGWVAAEHLHCSLSGRLSVSSWWADSWSFSRRCPTLFEEIFIWWSSLDSNSCTMSLQPARPTTPCWDPESGSGAIVWKALFCCLLAVLWSTQELFPHRVLVL